MMAQAAAPNFDFITSKQFRESLESDYADMRKCHEAGTWKSVQVLAGSIVEALLVDYIVAVPNANRPTKDPLKLDLAEAVALCRDERVVTSRTADLCSVIRSYRNLIHPGRAVRLGEPAASQRSADIALALVDMIADEVAIVRRASVGFTGEQIVSKIQRDASTLTILKHLLVEVPERERARLLLELIPGAYFKEWESGDDCNWQLLERLQRAYFAVFGAASEDTCKQAAAEFVRIIREEDGPRVERYGEAFFRSSDMRHVAEQHLPIVREHLLGRVGNFHTHDSLALVDGIEVFLTVDDVGKWFEPLLRTALASSNPASLKEAARNQLIFAGATLSDYNDLAAQFDRQLARAVARYSGTGAEELEQAALSLQKEVEELRSIL